MNKFPRISLFASFIRMFIAQLSGRSCLEAKRCIAIEDEPLLLFSVLLLASCLEANRCIPTQTTVQRPAPTSSKPPAKGLVPLAPGAVCPIRSCGRNEVLQKCGLCYETTCTDKSKNVCPSMCYCGCYCRRGFIRASKNGPCILPKQCPLIPVL
uniref:TIL domain-containing protein n=1 Tax=Anopheles epiroticus TaxID=199890 RepID=A0A182P749_9DIPT